MKTQRVARVAVTIFALLIPQSAVQALDFQAGEATPWDWRSDRALLQSLARGPAGEWQLALARGLAGPASDPVVEERESLFRRWLPLAVSFGAFALVTGLADAPREARWSEGNDFDDWHRRHMRASSGRGGDVADTVSDVMLYGTAGLWLAERLLAGWQEVRHARSRDPDLGGWQAAAITGGTVLEAFRTDGPWVLLSGLAVRGTKAASGRARPKTTDCLEISDGTNCGGRSGNQSFFSGHASLAATAAGLICTHRLERLDRGAFDVGLCTLAGAMAVTAGAMRVVGDEHWMTDAMMGSVTGVLFGWVLPNYAPFGPKRGPEPSHLAPRLRLQPMAGPDRYGVSLSLRY